MKRFVSLPQQRRTIIFWPESYGLTPKETEILVRDLIEWSKEEGFTCAINPGKR